jgi:hypothetical protein
LISSDWFALFWSLMGVDVSADATSLGCDARFTLVGCILSACVLMLGLILQSPLHAQHAIITCEGLCCFSMQVLGTAQTGVLLLQAQMLHTACCSNGMYKLHLTADRLATRGPFLVSPADERWHMRLACRSPLVSCVCLLLYCTLVPPECAVHQYNLGGCESWWSYRRAS